MSETVTFKFGRGDKVKHIMTEFEGFVIGQSHRFNGCVMYLLQPAKLDTNGALPASYAQLGEGEITLIQAKAVQPQIFEDAPNRPGSADDNRSVPRD